MILLEKPCGTSNLVQCLVRQKQKKAVEPAGNKNRVDQLGPFPSVHGNLYVGCKVRLDEAHVVRSGLVGPVRVG